MYDYLLSLYGSYGFLAYPTIVGLSIFEGPIVSIMLGSIIRLGYLNLYGVYVAVMLGDLLGDITLYYIGYRYGDRAIDKVRKKFTVTQEQVDSIKRKFHTRKYWVLFLSKISNGFGLSSVILLTSGIVRIRLFDFLLVNIVGQLIWSGMLLFIGYSFVDIYQTIDNATSKASWLLLVAIGALLIYLYRKYKV